MAKLLGPPTSPEDPRCRITPFQQMGAACSGALITSLFMTPFDVVKTRLQAQQRVLLSNKCYLYCNGLMDHLCRCGPGGNYGFQSVHFSGTTDAFVKITRFEGVSSLWSGLSPTLILALPTTVIYFVCYEQIRVRIFDYYKMDANKTVHVIASDTAKSIEKQQPPWIPLIAGASARIIAATTVSPLELIRTKMQSQKLSYSEIKVSIGELIRNKGPRGLWRGLTSTLLRDVPFSALYWTSYETLKQIFGHENPGKNSFSFNFILGGLAGTTAGIVTLPFDVVKTHQQIELGEKIIYADGKLKQPVMGTKEMLRHIYRMHGARGLFIGLIPRILKVAPACAIMIATFEYGKTFFQNYNCAKCQENWQMQIANQEPA